MTVAEEMALNCQLAAAEDGKVEVCAQLDQRLHDAIAAYVAAHPGWDSNRVWTAAMSLFLLQNGQGDVGDIYIDAMFLPQDR